MSIRQLRHVYAEPRRTRLAGPATTAALDGIHLDIQPREIFAVLGPNGSGKTTLFRILSTLIVPSQGQVHVFGNDVVDRPDAVRRVIGVLFQMPSLDLRLTATENLTCQGHLYGLAGGQLRQQIDELLQEVGMSDRKAEPVMRLSGGMRRRVELAKAILHEPQLLMLDEPATGLDPGARHDVWRLLERMRRDHEVTIILTTHLMDEADRCDRLGILSEGHLVAVDRPATLKDQVGGNVITIEPDEVGDIDQLRTEIDNRFGPWSSTAAPITVDGKIHLETSDGPTFVATLASALPGRTRAITFGKPTLEDVFLHLTGHTLWRSG